MWFRNIFTILALLSGYHKLFKEIRGDFQEFQVFASNFRNFRESLQISEVFERIKGVNKVSEGFRDFHGKFQRDSECCQNHFESLQENFGASGAFQGISEASGLFHGIRREFRDVRKYLRSVSSSLRKIQELGISGGSRALP